MILYPGQVLSTIVVPIVSNKIDLSGFFAHNLSAFDIDARGALEGVARKSTPGAGSLRHTQGNQIRSSHQ